MNRQTHKIGRLSSTTRRAVHVAFYIFLASGIFALSYVGYAVAESRMYQDLQVKRFHQTGPLLERHALAEGDVVGELDVPRLGLHAIVLHGDSPAQLRHAVGHLAKSAWPGEGGNVILAGHRNTFFRPLRTIRVGDEIRFTTRAGRFEYRVQSIEVVEPTEIRVLQSSTSHDLTLLTCFPFRYVGPAPKRFVVHAHEIEDGAIPESVHPAAEIEGSVPK
jgi:sortase A